MTRENHFNYRNLKILCRDLNLTQSEIWYRKTQFPVLLLCQLQMEIHQKEIFQITLFWTHIFFSDSSHRTFRPHPPEAENRACGDWDKPSRAAHRSWILESVNITRPSLYNGIISSKRTQSLRLSHRPQTQCTFQTATSND